MFKKDSRKDCEGAFYEKENVGCGVNCPANGRRTGNGWMW